jgi:outer membrane protein insertion porin family
MLHRVKYSFILCFILCSYSFSQSIESLQIKGSEIFSEEELIAWSNVKKGDKFSTVLIDSIKSRLALQLGNNGYFHSSFDNTSITYKPDSIHINISITVNDGASTKVKKIFYSGLDSLFSTKMIPFFSFMEGSIFNKFLLEENISKSLSYFENNGYPFAKIKVSSIYFYTDSVTGEYLADLHLNFSRENYSKIDRIEINGNTSTKDYVILRELHIKSGEEYSQNSIDRIAAKLNRLGFFNPLSVPEFYLNSNNDGVLKINVKEKVTNNFDGIIGYVPSTGSNQGGYLTGLVNVSLRNLFGTGRAASINWQQFNQSSQDLEIKYFEPWLFNYPFNFTADLFQRKQDSTYIQRKFEGTVEYLAAENLSASFIFSTELVIPSQSDSTVFTVFNSGSVSTGFNVKVDTRDDPYSPTSGLLFVTAYSFSRKRIYGPQQFITPDISTNENLQTFTIDLDLFYKLFNRQIGALGLHGREIKASYYEESDLFFFGGANSLRGYLENQFAGNRIAWSNLEYRLLLTNRTFGFLFFDTGYFLRSAEPLNNIETTQAFKIGYGLGFNVETALGVLKVSFALGQGDTFANGKIHFGIVNEF